MLLRRQVSEDRDEHIDMTPMVDVVFQLMTFMLFSVQLAGDSKVEVPRAQRGVGVEEDAATFLTLLKPDAPGAKPRLLLGNGDSGRLLDYEQAGAEVSKGVAQGRWKVIIQADGAVPEGEVLRLIGEIGKREAGVTVHIGVQEPDNHPMPDWDVFHSERLEAERSLTSQAVRDAITRGDLVEDDLIRPAGETRWSRLGDSPEFGPFPSPPSPTGEFPVVGTPSFEPPSVEVDEDGLRPAPEFDPSSYTEFEVVYEDDDPEPVLPDEQAKRPDLPELVELGIVAGADVFREGAVEAEFDPQDEDDEAAEFTLSRNSAETVEELDLAAMVDVAFQLVLFFLVTAQVVLFKTLEVPRPNEDKPPEAAAQGRSKSVDELEKDYILVEVDAAGAIKVDRQPIASNRAVLVETLRTSREKTARKAMLLSADFATRHENAVLVFDVANEIDLRIAIAQPPGKK